MKSHRASVMSVLVVTLAAIGSVGAIGCEAATDPAQSSAPGRVRLALSAQSPSGVSYRLTSASFAVTGPQTATLSTDADPNATVLSTELDAGSYSIELAPGWVLERVTNEGAVAVAATLVSPNPVDFEIHALERTGVAFQFSVAGEVVELGDGTLDVTIGVDDETCVAPLARCADECVDLTSDASNCGACEVVCDSGQCTNGVCTGCAPNQYDLDGNPANGCEYSCVFQSATDLPDDAFVDANCDGVDGNAAAAIFVAPSGSDGAAGTKAAPLQTIGAALARAQSEGLTAVYVSEGTYSERVTLANGISVYGGYSRQHDWQRSASYVSLISSTAVINSRVLAVEGTNITAPTTLDRLTIQSGNASGSGVSSYAMFCTGCSGVTLSNSSLSAGNGGAGSSGTSGSAGAQGTSGAPGGAGACSSTTPGASGAGGVNVCSGATVSGGAGGIGGTPGNPGATGQSGALNGGGGGIGGAGCDGGIFGTSCTASPGQNGSAGQQGAVGASGGAGQGGQFIGGAWVGGAGLSGATGTAGRGGGGGGGGGGENTLQDGAGNGGGGGGAGGCGGAFGTGGTAGGGSFGLVLIGSNGFTLLSNVIHSGNGGIGGAGANGGLGGNGGTGAQGATVCTSEVGRGGNGGNGGRGGDGGHGGGGAGGPSYAVYRSGTNVAVSGNVLTPGLGGNGGTSPGIAGSAGASAPVN
jgi:hypothetical protein